MLFTNHYELSVDHKHRISLPAEIRQELPQKVIYFQKQPEIPFGYLFPEKHITKIYTSLHTPLQPSFNLEQTLQQIQHPFKPLQIDKIGRINIGNNTPYNTNKVYLIGSGEYLILYLNSKQEFEKFISHLN
jgi:DNA-binding transcriptional regulator/RsmH inhibitor MraZ